MLALNTTNSGGDSRYGVAKTKTMRSSSVICGANKAKHRDSFSIRLRLHSKAARVGGVRQSEPDTRLTEKIMKELEYYYSALFKKAESYEKWRRIFLCIVLVFLSASLYASGKLLYSMAACAVVIQTFSLFLDLESKKNRSLANDFQKYSMLLGVFGEDADEHEISNLKIRAGNSIDELIRKKLDENADEQSATYTTAETDPKKRLIAMIQENSFWNHNLYRFSYKSYMTKIFFAIGLVVIAVLALIPSLKLDQDFTVLRLLFTVMSFSIIYEFIESTHKYKTASNDMADIDHKISRLDSIESQELLNIFSKYQLVKANTPPISGSVYDKNEKMLNQSWLTRRGNA